MAAFSGIWHGAAATPPVNPPATDTTSSSAGSATISANDFLTLLVTEMQNQDPTATTDPNEYINQLVNVNSLEQLIGINQTLSSAMGSPTGATAKPDSLTLGPSRSAELHSDQSNAIPSEKTPLSAAEPTAVHGASSAMASVAGAQSLAARGIPGNLNVPESKPAAHAVAHAFARR